MKAISVRQPYAWLIVNDWKNIENRSWSTTYRGSLLIHASRRVESDMIPWVVQQAKKADDAGGFPPASPIFRIGGIIGIVDLVDVVTISDNEWFNGPYGWVLANARPLEFYPCVGKVGLFDVSYPHNINSVPQESWLYEFVR